MFNQNESEEEVERQLLWRRVRTAIVGSIIIAVIGFFVVTLYTYTQYGGTPFDSLLGRGEKPSPYIGKLAYHRETNTYLGIIRGEGRSPQPGSIPVFYVERPGGTTVEYPQARIEVREPGQRKEGEQ